MQPMLKIVGLGEILWDMLPSGKQLGGAPSNFAYMASLLGDEGLVASRVGRDVLGKETLRRMARLGLGTQFVQLDSQHPTGTARVSVDQHGQPAFTITEQVAWDFMEWTPAWEDLAQHTDIACFGTLAQRSLQSQKTVQNFLRAIPQKSLRVFDVNLRQKYYNAELLADSLNLCQVVKVNHEELPVVSHLLALKFGSEEAAARRLLDEYELKLVCVTRGGSGSLLVSTSGTSSHPGFRVQVADTVGAGDAFTACLAHHLARGASLETINENANRFAAWVASQRGGTPSLGKKTPQEALQAIAGDK